MNEIDGIETELKYSAHTQKIISCAMEVHNHIGNGFQEVIYQRALAIEMEHQGLGFAREEEMPVYSKEVQVGSRRVDFLVEDLIAVELKAVVELEKVHLAQAVNYLEAFNLEVGLLINFGDTRLRFHRLHNKKFQAS